jgi:hypothetical protein
MNQAGFSPCHQRDGRAGTTILQLVSTFYDRTQALLSDYGPARAAGARATPHPPGPTLCGTTGLTEQREAVAELSLQQDLSKDYGPTWSSGRRRRLRRAAVPFKELRAGRIRRRTMPEYTAARGRLDHATFWEQSDASVQCTGFWAKLLHADRTTGLGPGSQ